MARDITTITQTNLWGKQAETGMGLEPQRTDLWFLNVDNARQNVATAANIALSTILPQYVRSVTMPELRTKADVIRRDSIPFQMPSWDDPLDAIKIVFLLDTHEQDDTSNVVQFLDAWLALTRAGRGNRFNGFNVNPGWMTLNSEYRVDCMFDIDIWLLRGANLTVGGFSDNSQSDEFKAQMAQANATFRNRLKREGKVQMGNPVPQSPETSLETALSSPVDEGDVTDQDMVAHTIYTLNSAWLGGYKISDLTYTESALVTVEATFYADDLSTKHLAQYTGEAKII
jgi:hypothetical protein